MSTDPHYLQNGRRRASRAGQPTQWPLYLPVLRFALLNMAGFALLAAAYLQGWIDIVLRADGTGLPVVIFAVFVVGLAMAARLIWRISIELNCLRGGTPCARSRTEAYFAEVRGRSAGSRAISSSALRMKMANGISGVRHIANTLVLLGLIGTVLGLSSLYLALIQRARVTSAASRPWSLILLTACPWPCSRHSSAPY